MLGSLTVNFNGYSVKINLAIYNIVVVIKTFILKSYKKTNTYYLGMLFLQHINLIFFSMLNTFRIIAFLEGVSYILLLFVAVPVKYLMDDSQYVKMLGMPHGLLFISYITLAILLRSEFKWNTKNFGFILLASIIPFGTFYIDRKYLKHS